MQNSGTMLTREAARIKKSSALASNHAGAVSWTKGTLTRPGSSPPASSFPDRKGNSPRPRRNRTCVSTAVPRAGHGSPKRPPKPPPPFIVGRRGLLQRLGSTHRLRTPSECPAPQIAQAKPKPLGGNWITSTERHSTGSWNGTPEGKHPQFRGKEHHR